MADQNPWKVLDFFLSVKEWELCECGVLQCDFRFDLFFSFSF